MGKKVTEIHGWSHPAHHLWSLNRSKSSPKIKQNLNSRIHEAMIGWRVTAYIDQNTLACLYKRTPPHHEQPNTYLPHAPLFCGTGTGTSPSWPKIPPSLKEHFKDSTSAKSAVQKEETGIENAPRGTVVAEPLKETHIRKIENILNSGAMIGRRVSSWFRWIHLWSMISASL